MNGAQWFVRTLTEAGVDRVFVLCGNGLNPFLDACLDYGVKIIDVRNEQAASYMADTWGRFTRKLGVVAVSSGPGHTNALTGLTNSWWDGGPMLLVSGCSELETRGKDHFQELDQVGLARPVCKYAELVRSPQNLPTAAKNAITTALTGRPGPVHLTIPRDVFMADVKMESKFPVPKEVISVGAGEAPLVEKAVKMLHEAKKPIIVAGSGCFYARAWPAIKEFAALSSIPIFSLLWDRCCIEESIPQYVGIVSTEVNAGAGLIAEADVILTLGARVDYRLSFGEPPMVSPDAKFIRIDTDPSEVHRVKFADVGIVGSPREVLKQIIKKANSLHWKNGQWLSQIVKRRQENIDFWVSRKTEDIIPISSLGLCLAIKPFLSEDVTFLLDGGNIGRWAHMLLFDRHPSFWFTCGISGVVGWGIPGAMAARLARPEKPVLLLSGDGAGGFTLGDIQTAVRFGTPYVAVIAHDSAWGIVVDLQPEGRCAGSKLGEIRFDRVAKALGAEGVYIDNAGQIAAAIEEGLRAKTPTFIHVPTMGLGIESYKKLLDAV
jgi:acetolactate synthase-1/2/3 large subunit